MSLFYDSGVGVAPDIRRMALAALLRWHPNTPPALLECTLYANHGHFAGAEMMLRAWHDAGKPGSLKWKAHAAGKEAVYPMGTWAKRKSPLKLTLMQDDVLPSGIVLREMQYLEAEKERRSMLVGIKVDKEEKEEIEDAASLDCPCVGSREFTEIFKPDWEREQEKFPVPVSLKSPIPYSVMRSPASMAANALYPDRIDRNASSTKK